MPAPLTCQMCGTPLHYSACPHNKTLCPLCAVRYCCPPAK